MTRTSRTTTHACTAALATLLLSLTACGGGSEEPAPADEEPAIEEPADEEPADEEAAIEEPAAEEAVAVEPAAAEPAVAEKTVPADEDATAGEAADAPEPEPKGGSAALADGTYEGRLVTIDSARVTLELVRVLSGEEAIAAATADDGPLDEDGELPNDVYVQDLGETVTVPVAGDGGFQILDCHTSCELKGTTLDALARGEATPYGGIMTVKVDGGAVVSLIEVYLP